MTRDERLTLVSILIDQLRQELALCQHGGIWWLSDTFDPYVEEIRDQLESLKNDT